MQLLSLILYNAEGETRVVEFRPGRLNIVTGVSKAGKSALLGIIDYCLGHDKLRFPLGSHFDSVVWYGAIWQLPGGQVFTGRPAARSSTQRAMIEFGDELLPPRFENLAVNTDSTALRTQIGRRIGIEENLTAPPSRSGRPSFEANLGHAVLLCLQGQNEIADFNSLFHRQAEPRMPEALRDTIPYFLGAAPRDQALRRAQLRDARHTLQRNEAALAAAELAAETIDAELRALHTEARAVGLLEDTDIPDRATLIRSLQAVRAVPPLQQRQPASVDLERQNRYVNLEGQLRDARYRLNRVLADRSLLLEERSEESGYEGALRLQAGRLTTLNLIASSAPDSSNPSGDGASACPACGQATAQPDPTVSNMRSSLERLQSQLANLAEARPARRNALAELDDQATTLRTEISSLEQALSSVRGSAIATDQIEADGRAFTRGRIDAILSRVTAADDIELARLKQAVDNARDIVSSLERELDGAELRELLNSALFSISRDMTDYARRLELEHSEGTARLDLAKLTVAVEKDDGTYPLLRIGSAENWIGYHLAAHLGLHRFLVRNERPVPRFLILDQPSQGHYPADVATPSGIPQRDQDREAVRRIFRLLYDVAQELAPNMQIIVCDHAYLPDEWFVDSVEHNWRNGLKLIPEDWAT
ncbi:DUF3732 domain-containing protein [Actinoallomurus sp. CA-150999]|uniref:DUF3732 domain-containing protein n=1 Tax=Actinoallomurus sp. CA-150999 TaxID=3239887 RepID=UPI003D904829